MKPISSRRRPVFLQTTLLGLGLVLSLCLVGCDQELEPVEEIPFSFGSDVTEGSDTAASGGNNIKEPPNNPPNLRKAKCGSPDHPLQLASHLTEADEAFVTRVANLDASALPKYYNMTQLMDLDRSLIAYMLDDDVPDLLGKHELLAKGLLGKSILLALGSNDTPVMTDYKELRRGLYHYYNCSRGHPATLDGFISVYGDFTEWTTFEFINSYPKIYPRRMWVNTALGIYVAETMRDGEVSETEVLLSGYRNDGALEFLAYLPNGELTNRGEFRAGAGFVAGAAPYTCMSCHRDTKTGTYTKIFPELTLNK